jgi:hypothetical protein
MGLSAHFLFQTFNQTRGVPTLAAHLLDIGVKLIHQGRHR